jgi:outer membrane receptor protein involved in Fe transport
LARSTDWKRILASSVALITAASLSVDIARAQIEEITVTARKKEEILQDVPLSVTAFSAADIERKGIKSLDDIAKYTASIQFDESFAQSDTRIVFRGLSPTRGRQNGAILLDGIDSSSEAITSSGGSLLINTRLTDLERIEIVLGPQLALYGRSAFNGAINYVTKDPADEFKSEITLEGNDEDQYNLRASLSGPLIGESLGFRLNAAWWDEEGFYENTLTGDDIGGSEGYGIALTLQSEIGNNLSIRFRGEYTDDEGSPSPQAFLPFNTALAAPAGAFEAGIAECWPDFIVAVNDPVNGVAGSYDNLLERGQRIVDPALAADLDGLSFADFEQRLRDGDNLIEAIAPYCESGTLAPVGQVPDGDDLDVRLATDPDNPGEDYPGFEREIWRASLIAEFTVEGGTFTSLSGYTRSENFEAQDNGAFGVPGPGRFGDVNVNSFAGVNDNLTEQYSQEVRFATDFGGSINLILGGLYWREEVENDARSITAQSAGSHCFWESRFGFLNPIGIQDGCTGYTEVPYAPYQNAAFPFRPKSPADRETEHWSFYGLVDVELTDTWTLSFEGRYNEEEVQVFGPLFYDPGASGGPGGLNPCGIFFRACEPFNEWIAAGNFFADSFDPAGEDDPQAYIDAIPQLCREQDPAAVRRSIDFGPADDLNGDGEPDGIDVFNPWCVDKLEDDDSWFSPKVTLDWHPTDDTLLYMSWARARKPGGFSLLTVGSSGLNRDLTEFGPEKMDAWEFGGKTAWFRNSLVVNGALFFQDFTDKQVLTSALGNDGRLVSKVENASSAEVWGAELTVSWQPPPEFLGGTWLLTGSYTWLDTEYSNFRVETGSTVRASQAGNCVPTVVGTEQLCTIDLSGNSLEDAPEGSFVGSIGYVLPLGGSIDLFLETDIQWQDRRFTDETNQAWVDEFWNVDLRLGLESDRWELLAYVKNLLDDDTVRFTGGGPGLGCCFILASSIDAAANTDVPPDSPAFRAPEPAAAVIVDLPLFASGFLPDPRVIGVQATYRFGARGR